MSHYYADSGQLEKGITALELYKQTYPRDSIPYTNVSGIYLRLGQFENALSNAKQAVEADPEGASGYANLANSYQALNRLDEAKATLNQAIARGLGGSGFHIQLASIAWLQNDSTEMERQLQLVKTGPDGELNVLGFRLGLAAFQGQIKKVRELGKQMRETADRLSLKEAAASEYQQEGVVEAVVGNKAQALTEIGRASCRERV